VKDDAGGQKDSRGQENPFAAAGRLCSRLDQRRQTMDYAVVRYGVKQAAIEENRALIAKVFQELDQSAPAALRYLVLELDDGEFVHIVATVKTVRPPRCLGLPHSRLSPTIMRSGARPPSADRPPGSWAITA
jgi:hypothetical protein